MAIKKTGDWQRAMHLLTQTSRHTGHIISQALAQEAQALRTLIVQGITKQAPGDKPLQPLAELTKAQRRLKRFLGTKALMKRGDLRNSISVVSKGDTAFVGVLRRAKGGDNGLVDVAEVQEFGAGPTIVPITPAMRRFLGALFREAGGERKPGNGKRKDFIVIVVPPRPFLRPAAEVFKKVTRKRFLKRLTRNLALGEA